MLVISYPNFNFPKFILIYKYDIQYRLLIRLWADVKQMLMIENGIWVENTAALFAPYHVEYAIFYIAFEKPRFDQYSSRVWSFLNLFWPA